MVCQRTLVLVKPDGVQRGLVGDVLRRFELKGFKIAALKFVQPSEDLAKQHYAALSAQPFFANLVKFTASAPVVAIVVEGKGVIAAARRLVGDTDPAKAPFGTIRADYSIEISRNVVHASDGEASANKEIQLWFKTEDLVNWKSSTDGWVHE